MRNTSAISATTVLPVQRVSSLAVTSSVLGLFSFTCLPRIPAVICGVIALIHIRRSNGKLRGMRWAAIGITLPVAFVLFLTAYLRVIPGLGWYHDRNLTETATGVPFVLGRPQLVYDSERSPLGDGYSIAACKIPDHAFRRFQSEDFPSGPKKGMFREKWTVVKWKRGPVAPEDLPYVNFAFATVNHSSDSASQI